ncbi:MAG: hypothetical protein ACKVIN_00070 [Longimicrobiales bacterium]|jgi:hypothetical protein
MRKPSRLLVAALMTPFLSGCFSVTQVAVPPGAQDRDALNVRGLVVRQAGGTEQTIEFETVHDLEWTPTSLSVVADASVDGETQTITRLYSISTMSGVLVRSLDAAKTSGIIGAVILGTVAFIAVAVTGGGVPIQQGN